MMNIPVDEHILWFHFQFTFQTGDRKEILVQLDRKTLNVAHSEARAYPPWAELGFLQCPMCPLNKALHQFCPMAVSLVELIDTFKDSISYEDVKVCIRTATRTYLKQTTLQKGLSSLLGILMAASGCPVMDKLKPMVRHHLPFATKEETMYRVISMYLLAQYFRYKRELTPDWELKHLVDLYRDIKLVNKQMSERLAHLDLQDAGPNALVILDWFAETLIFAIDRNILDEIESAFNAYFTE
jgi:hypothetical protein